MSSLANWIESHAGECTYVQAIGVECPWCGIQRSSVHLLRGEWLESVQMFPALIPALLMILGLIAHLVFKFPKGALYLKWNFFVVVGLILGNYIFKLLF